MTDASRQGFPFLATGLVAVAIAAMIALGFWQIARAHQKDALLARYGAAALLPPTVWPDAPPPDDRLLFRRAAGFCAAASGWTVMAGRSRGGEPGWRHIARCGAAAGRPGMLVDAGWSAEWMARTPWNGGPVSGMVSLAPDPEPLVAHLVDALNGRAAAPVPMLVLDRPAPGLMPSAFPDPADIPHNHRSYAVQWFSFAAIAAVIYVVALLKRRRIA